MIFDDLKSLILDNEIKFVRVEVEDTNAISKGFNVDSEHFLSNYKKGYLYNVRVHTATAADEAVENSGIISNGDALMYPELSTVKVLPWVPGTLSVLVDSVVQDSSGNILEISTRSICKRILNRVEKLGMKVFGAFEYEFYVLDRKSRLPAFPDISVYSPFSYPKFNDITQDIFASMKHIGLKPERYLVESGVSQFEITYNPAFGIFCADNAFRFRHLVKEIVSIHDNLATFQSKPFNEYSGSSGHFNLSLWSLDGNKNLFVDKVNGLSTIAKYWIAGLQHHAKALVAFAAPTPNCYKRIGKSESVPLNNKLGMDDRTCAYRVKNSGKENTYIEDRRPGATINPYLYLAASTIAGLDGIERQLQLKSEEEEFDMPRTLPIALKCLNDDDIMVNGLGRKFIEMFSAIKLSEWNNQENLNINSRYVNI